MEEKNIEEQINEVKKKIEKNLHFIDDLDPKFRRHIMSDEQAKHLNNGRWNIRRFSPWYSDEADYNTNAKSYYDYLARLNYFLEQIVLIINKLLRREIYFHDTDTIDFNQNGDWESVDDILVNANVKLSGHTHDATHAGIKRTYKNAVIIDKDPDGGIFVKDFTDEINEIHDEITDIYNKIKDIYNKIENLQKQINDINNRINKLLERLQPILDNLYASGAITSNDINKYEFNPDRYIATGNLNVTGYYPGKTPHVIITHKGNEPTDLHQGKQ